ncbi:acyl-CoA synthetase [Lysobacter capsici]|uniref:acyl-CoA synthetase n=1 Tax=Lysobacter capsici TaxID=435897 RepID=UPI001C004C04|nr:acyl-CoA synthetase [Lysobacter capsici]QWF15911.1 acyl-CoA synthetase [Lysobacter capsici]
MSGIGSLRDIEALERAGPPALPASTLEMIRQGAAIDPAAPALSFFLRTADHARAERYDYAQLLRQIHRSANAFHALGANRDSVIAYVLPNLPETHFVLWGGEAAGIVMAINPLLDAQAIGALLAQAGATLLVTLAPFPGVDLWQRVCAALPMAGDLRHVLLVDLAAHVPGPKRVIAQLLGRRERWRLHGWSGVRGAVPARIEVHDFHNALRGHHGDGLDSGRRIEPGDRSSYFCTGGTTGLPKIAVRTHANEVANAWSAGQFFGDDMGSNKNLFCGLPLFHVNAAMATGLMPFSRGAHVILGTPQGYRGEGVVPRFWELVERHRIHFFSGVPTLYAALMQVPLAGRDVSSLEYGLCGAAPMPVEVIRGFQQRTGLKILEGYGLTESTCVSSLNPPLGERRIGSIGLRLPGQRMKAVLLDEAGAYLRDCAVDEVGVIAISGPNVFAGYKVEAHNREVWIDCGDGLRWLNTGDLGRQDADGYFWLTGRRKDLIIRGGHNIDPASIEAPLHRHPAVAMAAAVGRPDAHAGEVPVAYVQLQTGASASEDELLAFAREHVAERAAVPRAIHVLDALPLTPVGKIYKPALKQREIVDALGEALRAGGVEAQVSAREDGSRGVVVEVELRDQSQAEAAQRILGLFAFAFELHVDRG